MSPPVTTVPLFSCEKLSSMRNPLAPLSEPRSKEAAQLFALPKTTYEAPAKACGPVEGEPGAPTMTSSYPSPLTSPALETDQPLLSSELTPCNAKPLAPLRSDKLSV